MLFVHASVMYLCDISDPNIFSTIVCINQWKFNVIKKCVCIKVLPSSRFGVLWFLHWIVLIETETFLMLIKLCTDNKRIKKI